MRLSRLPGIGRRSAQRLAFHLLKQPLDEATQLAGAITDLKRCVKHCSVCFSLTETDRCSVCTDPKRDHSLIMVVEQPDDVAVFETTGTYHGVYHVLMGRLSPLDGIGPGELNITVLLERVGHGQSGGSGDPDSSPENPVETTAILVREVILGTSPTLEGDGTALYLTEQLSHLAGVKVTRLARGLPAGSSLERVSKAVLSDSVHGRQPMVVD